MCKVQGPHQVLIVDLGLHITTNNYSEVITSKIEVSKIYSGSPKRKTQNSLRHLGVLHKIMALEVSDKGRKAFQAERTERAKAWQFGNVTR